MSGDKVMLLIDADNVSVDIMEQAVELLLDAHGALHLRRAYCTAESALKHQSTFKRLGIKPMVNLAAGKNSTDIAMAVDAIDLVIAERPDIVAIASSDSDFAPLVMRLREKGCRVVGIGQDGKTGDETISVYDGFTVLAHRKGRAAAPAARGSRAPARREAPQRGTATRTAAAAAAPAEAAETSAPAAASAATGGERASRRRRGGRGGGADGAARRDAAALAVPDTVAAAAAGAPASTDLATEVATDVAIEAAFAAEAAADAPAHDTVAEAPIAGPDRLPEAAAPATPVAVAAGTEAVSPPFATAPARKRAPRRRQAAAGTEAAASTAADAAPGDDAARPAAVGQPAPMPAPAAEPAPASAAETAAETAAEKGAETVAEKAAEEAPEKAPEKVADKATARPSRTAPAKKAPAKKAARRAAEAASAPASAPAPAWPDEIRRILAALPELLRGETLELRVATERLRDAELLGPRASSTRFFAPHAERFELLPAGQPNKVRLRPV